VRGGRKSHVTVTGIEEIPAALAERDENAAIEVSAGTVNGVATASAVTANVVIANVEAAEKAGRRSAAVTMARAHRGSLVVSTERRNLSRHRTRKLGLTAS